MGYTLDSTVKEVMSDARARAVVEQHVPGATDHPLLPDAMYMTLGEVASFATIGVGRARVQALLEDLAKLETQE